jgi:hypothetical protein
MANVFIDVEKKLEDLVADVKAALTRLEAHVKGWEAEGASPPSVDVKVEPGKLVATITPAPPAVELTVPVPPTL